MKPLVVLGWASAEARSKTRKRMTDLAARLGELCDLDVGVTPVPTYERLAELVSKREIDLAWLSPIVLVSLARNKHVVPLLSFCRDRKTNYTCALLVSPTSHISTFEELHGKRVAWVDWHSAAGYVLPRIELAAHGVRAANLGEERICGATRASCARSRPVARISAPRTRASTRAASSSGRGRARPASRSRSA